jgi:hypothetical protein
VVSAGDGSEHERWRGVVLANGESVVKEYHASQSVVGGLRAFLMNLFAGPGIEGGDRYLIATTERLLLVGDAQVRGGTGRVVNEVQIGLISGLSCSIASGWMAGWALFRLAWRALIGLAVVFVLSQISGFFWLLILVWGWWLIRALMAQGQRISVVVHAKDAHSSPVVITSQAAVGRFSGHFEVFDMPAEPGRDAEAMTQELGALIRDIQTNPDSAIERWATAPVVGSRTGLPVGDDVLSVGAPGEPNAVGGPEPRTLPVREN